jgi:hypothetical protein
VAEGEVTFKSLLFVPVSQKTEDFQKYGSTDELIKLYVRRVFITDDFKDMMPSYLSFVRGLFILFVYFCFISRLFAFLLFLVLFLIYARFVRSTKYELSNLLFSFLRFAI